MKRYKLLILDDSEEHLVLMKEATDKLDCDAYLTQNFQDALDYCSTNHVDILISDLNMGKDSGFDFIALTNKTPNAEKMKRIIYSSDSPTNKTEKMDELNIVGWIVKPANQNAVIETIKKIFQRIP